MGIRNGLVCVFVVAVLSACGGKPSNSAITETLEGAAQAGLKVNGFQVPSSAVKLEEIEVGAVQSVKAQDGLDHYYVDGTATVILTGTGEDVAQKVESASRQAAESASLTNIESVVMGGAFGAAGARLALHDIIPGTGFKYPFEAMLTKVDGEWRATEFRSKDGVAFATEQSRAIAAENAAAAQAAARAREAEPKVVLLSMSNGNKLDEATGKAVRSEFGTYNAGETLFAVIEVEAEPGVEAKAKAGHVAQVSVRWHGPKGDEILKKESTSITAAGKRLIVFSLADTQVSGNYWASVFIDAQDDQQANPGSFQVLGGMPVTEADRQDAAINAAIAAEKAESAAREQLATAEATSEAIEHRRQVDEARRVADERQSAEYEVEQRELARQRKEADALGRLQAEHQAQLDAEDPIRK